MVRAGLVHCQFTAAEHEKLTSLPPASHPGWKPLPASIKGGKIDKPGAGIRSISVTTYSGKTLRVRQSNASHAERHLADFVNDFKSKTVIVGVDLEVRGKWTPCRNCAQTLTQMAIEIFEEAGSRKVAVKQLTLKCPEGVSLHPDCSNRLSEVTRNKCWKPRRSRILMGRWMWEPGAPSARRMPAAS